MSESDNPETVRDYVEQFVRQGLEQAISSLEESVDILGIQGQLSTLAARITAQEDQILQHSRLIAVNSIDLDLHWIQNYVNERPITDDASGTNALECVRRIREVTTARRATVAASTNPHSIVDECYNTCKAIMIRFGFGDFYPD